MVNDGYKQTDIGIIPDDWNIVELGNIGSFKNGINKSKEDFGFGNPFVNLMDVFGKSKILGNEKFDLINSNDIENKLYNLKQSDILFIRSSVKPTGVGLTSLIYNDIDNTVFSGFLIRYRTDSSLATVFKEHCFYEENFRKRLISASTISANTNINQEALKKLLLIIPPLEEQKAIAIALGDTDELINSLEKLIYKKEDIKTATMQQLLTGKKRLDGFSGEWKIKLVKEIASVITGSKNTQDKVNNGKYPFYVRSQTIESINSYSFDGEAILTAGDGVGVGKVFHYINGKFDYHQRVYNICNFKINGFFFFLYFKNNFFDRVMSMTAKSSVDSVRKEMISEMEIPIPPTLKEQTAIASILSDIDKELKKLKLKLSKIKAIKEGMMQELLTGKTRLI